MARLLLCSIVLLTFVFVFLAEKQFVAISDVVIEVC